jgi:Amt family ammonium transporter
MHFIPGLRLRVTEEAEILGIDDAEMGEFAYDYVGIDTELGHNTQLGPAIEATDSVEKKEVVTCSTEGSEPDAEADGHQSPRADLA